MVPFHGTCLLAVTPNAILGRQNSDGLDFYFPTWVLVSWPFAQQLVHNRSDEPRGPTQVGAFRSLTLI